MLFQKVATFEEPEENIDSEDGIKDIIFCHQYQRSDTKPRELSKPLKMALSIFNSFEKLYHSLFQKEKEGKDKGRPEYFSSTEARLF